MDYCSTGEFVPQISRIGVNTAAVYPRTEVQLCIVHLVGASMNYVPWKARKSVAADLQLIYRASTAAEAVQHLAQLEGNWKTYPSVSQVWRRNWAQHALFQLSARHLLGYLHHQQRGFAEPVVAQDHQNPRADSPKKKRR
jgi:hypothetical protein